MNPFLRHRQEHCFAWIMHNVHMYLNDPFVWCVALNNLRSFRSQFGVDVLLMRVPLVLPRKNTCFSHNKLIHNYR